MPKLMIMLTSTEVRALEIAAKERRRSPGMQAEQFVVEALAPYMDFAIEAQQLEDGQTLDEREVDHRAVAATAQAHAIQARLKAEAAAHDKSGYHVPQGPPAPSPRPSETLPGARRDDPSAEADRAAPAGALPPQE